MKMTFLDPDVARCDRWLDDTSLYFIPVSVTHQVYKSTITCRN